jgi:hypothetical protein
LPSPRHRQRRFADPRDDRIAKAVSERIAPDHFPNVSCRMVHASIFQPASGRSSP